MTTHGGARQRIGAIAATLAIGMGGVGLPGTGFGGGFTAVADEMDDLIKDLDRVSKDIEAQTEEHTALVEELEAKKKQLGEARAAAALAREQAHEAAQCVEEARIAVDRLAQAQYRESNYDPITGVMTASGPQTAIDRSAYIGSLARRSEKIMSGYVAANKQRSEAMQSAAQAEATVEFETRQLSLKAKELGERTKNLKAEQEKIKQRIDGLTVEQKLRWAAKNDPTTVSLAGISSNNPDGLKALQAGYTKIGAPYSWGSAGPNSFDCSGLVVWSYAQAGKKIPRTSQAQMAGGTPVPRSQLQAGDVVGFYPNATHVGIYAGNGMVLHASDYGIPVQVVPMGSMPFYGARRY